MKFQLGDHVRKTKGSEWKGVVVGTYSTTLTPEGYAVESSTEKGSVQIYPAAALEAASLQEPCDMGDLCLGCSPRNRDGSCPDAAPSQEPDINAETMLRLIQTIKYMVGIAERGRGYSCPDDVTPEKFLLEYVIELEAAPSQEPVGEVVAGIGTMRKVKWYSGLLPESGSILYTAPPDAAAQIESLKLQLRSAQEAMAEVLADAGNAYRKGREDQIVSDLPDAFNSIDAAAQIARYKSQAELWACSTDEALKKIEQLQADSDDHLRNWNRVVREKAQLIAAARFAINELDDEHPDVITAIGILREVLKEGK